MYKSFTDGGSTTDTSTTKEVDLGTLQVLDGEGGPVTWIYVYNDHATIDWFDGCIVNRETPGSGTHAATKGMPFDGTRSAGTVVKWLILGVAQGVIEAGEYGWIVAKGVCTVKGDAALAQGELIVTDTAGLCDTVAAGAETQDGFVFGIALEDSPASLLTTCIIDVV